MEKYTNNNYIGAEYIDGINGEEAKRGQLKDDVSKTGMEGGDFLEGKDYISYETSAGNVRIFIENGQPYIELKAGYDKEDNLKKFSTGKGKNKEGEKLELTAASENYEEVGGNTFKWRKDDGVTITGGGTRIINESLLIGFEDNKDFIKNKDSKEKHIEHNKKTTNINFQETIISTKKSKSLIEGYEVEDKANGKKRIIKAIPLFDYKKYVEKKQWPMMEKAISEFNKNGKTLERATDFYKNEVEERLVNKRNVHKERLDYIDKIFNDFIYTSTGIKDIGDKPVENINPQTLLLYAKYLKENKVEGFDFIKEEDIENLSDIFSKLWDYKPHNITDDQRKKEDEIYKNILNKINEIKYDNKNDFLDGFGNN